VGFDVSISPHPTPPKTANFSTASSKLVGLCSLQKFLNCSLSVSFFDKMGYSLLDNIC